MARAATNLLALALLAALLFMLWAVLTPNGHVLEKHPEAAYLFDYGGDDLMCKYRSLEKRRQLLLEFDPSDPCAPERYGGVFLTIGGATITAFIAARAWWKHVIRRDGFSRE